MQTGDLATLKPLFEPESIAIIGASNNFFKPSGQPLYALVNNGYKGKIYPVNPKYDQLLGLPCYPDILAVPGPVDLAIIAVPAAAVEEQLIRCGEKGVKGVIIFTSGFGEVDEEGKKKQNRLVEIARRYGIRICGPNCMGIFGHHNALMANFAIMELPQQVLVPDFLGFISQSGGFGAAIYQIVSDWGVGFTYFISSGNEADVDFSQYLAYMAADNRTRVIGGYLEGVRDGRRFRKAVEMAHGAGKPILIIKTGRSQVAARAAASHTGSIVGSDRVYDAFFRQHGIMRVDGIEELTMTLSFLAAGRVPRGNRVGILCTSGGGAVLLADKCTEYGMEVVELTPATQARLTEMLPFFAATRNPVDITSQIMVQPNLLSDSARVMLSDPNIDILVAAYWVDENRKPQLDQMIQVARETDKTVLNMLWGKEEHVLAAIRYLRQHMVPAIGASEAGLRSLSYLIRYASYLASRESSGEKPVIAPTAKAEAEKIIADYAVNGKLSEYPAKQILRAYGIPTVREVLAGSEGEAVRAAVTLGFPVVMKIEAPEILHKTEIGGVRLNLRSEEEVRVAYREMMAAVRKQMPAAQVRGVLVQEMVSGGVELLAGISRDPVFGPTIAFGLGGIFVEALQDVSLRVAPLRRVDAEQMINEIRGQKVLEGFRGSPPVDRQTVADILLRLSCLAEDLPQVRELDLNPLIAVGNKVKAADAIVVLE